MFQRTSQWLFSQSFHQRRKDVALTFRVCSLRKSSCRQNCSHRFHRKFEDQVHHSRSGHRIPWIMPRMERSWLNTSWIRFPFSTAWSLLKGGCILLRKQARCCASRGMNKSLSETVGWVGKALSKPGFRIGSKSEGKEWGNGVKRKHPQFPLPLIEHPSCHRHPAYCQCISTTI